MIGTGDWPYALATYKVAYPDRDYEAIISPAGRTPTDSLIAKCVLADGVEDLVLGGSPAPYFTKDPNEDPAWSASVREQTPPPPPAGMPMFLQGEAGIVVTAGSKCPASFQNQWCAKGSHRQPVAPGSITKTRPWPPAPQWSVSPPPAFAGTPAVSTCAFGVQRLWNRCPRLSRTGRRRQRRNVYAIPVGVISRRFWSWYSVQDHLGRSR